METVFNPKLWEEAFTHQNWYDFIYPQYQQLEALAAQEPDYERRKAIKGPMYQAVADALRQGRIQLATSGDNNDAPRLPIDMLVVHHTKNKPGMTLAQLNAKQLLRLYGAYYAHPKYEQDAHIKGQPVWSGHFYQGQQVFWAYHWLIREDGSAEQILRDEYLGWHAGNWQVNRRSIAVALDDDLTAREPSEKVLDGLAAVIRHHYGAIRTENIVGHCDVANTICPGTSWPIWRQKLLARL